MIKGLNAKYIEIFYNHLKNCIYFRLQLRQNILFEIENINLVYKNMKINRLISFSFSKCFDVISFGAYANRVSKLIAGHSKRTLSILTIQEQNSIIQSSLIPIGGRRIRVKQNNHTFSNIEMGVGLQQIVPDESQVILKNGQSYKYKYLVYSGNNTDWKGQDSISVESASIKNPYSFIYDDLQYKNIQQFFARRSGSIIVTMPKQRNFSSQNFFLMLLKSRMKLRRKNAPFYLQPIKLTLVCQGNKIVPFNESLNSLIQNYLAQSQISIVKNANYFINYRKKLLKLTNEQKQIKFDALFHYLPLRTPQILAKAKINPFQNNRHKLNNSRYQNIYILGNVVNNVYSLSCINQMSKIITLNILNSIQNTNKMVVYQGNSSLNIWLDHNQCHFVQTDYNGSRLKRNIGQSSILRRLVASQMKNKLYNNVHQLINQGCRLNSMFNKYQYIGTQRFQVPTVLNHLQAYIL